MLGLLGKERSDNGLGKYDVVEYLDEHPAKAAQVALALGWIEGARASTGRDGSRRPRSRTSRLASWRYELSDVERQAVEAGA